MARDPLDKNDAITHGKCDTVTVCVPNINIPDSVKDLTSTGLKKEENQKLLNDVNGIADKLKSIPEARLTVNPINPHPDESLEADTEAPMLQNKQPDYNDLAAFLSAPFPTHDVTEFNIDDDNSMQDALKKLGDLLKEDVDVEEKVKDLDNSTLTERIVDGHGVFDWLASATFNQLDMVRKKELIDKSDFANVYTQSLNQVLQVASQFTLERDKTYWANLLVRSQMAQANVQALLAKAQLITLPIEVKLKYAQLHAQLQQMKLVGYQVESEKARIKQTEAQTDQILAQTDGIRLQNELQQIQIQDAVLKLEVSREQVIQSKEQTKQLVAQTKQITAQTKQIKSQTEQAVEQTKLSNAQWQKTLKEIKLVEANVIETEAKIKLMAQQTQKEINQIELVKGQTAEAYSRIALLGEQIKAAKAQYSDTIDGEPVKGIIGTQNALHRKQSLSYDRDSLYKVLQLQAQAWQTKKTADIGTKSPAAFTAASVDGMLQEYLATYYNDANTQYTDLSSKRTRVANGSASAEVSGRININTLKPVKKYKDYVTDPEMDAGEPTSYGNSA
nr:MAG: hypothetical protein [Enquatrovirus sp.]